jgi:hypothetical protein
MNEVPNGYGHGLAVVYLTWLLVVILLYFHAHGLQSTSGATRDGG